MRYAIILFLAIALNFGQDGFSVYFNRIQQSNVDAKILVKSNHDGIFTETVTIFYKSSSGTGKAIVSFSEKDKNEKIVVIPALSHDDYEFYLDYGKRSFENEYSNDLLENQNRTKKYRMTFANQLDHFEVIPSRTNVVGGAFFDITVRAVDDSGQLVEGYVAGPLLISTTGGQSNLPTSIHSGDSLFVKGTPGEATIPFAYSGNGDIQIVVNDSAQPIFTGTSELISVSSPADHFEIEILNPKELQVGQAFDMTIRAKDISNVTMTTFEGTVKLGSTYEQVSNLPNQYTFTLADAGEKTFTGIIINSADTGYVYATSDGTESLIAYYDFEESVDDKAFGMHGATNTEVTFSDGLISEKTGYAKDFGKAGVFNGYSSHLVIPNHSENQLTNYTITAWVKWDSGQGGSQSVAFGKGHRGTGVNNMMVKDNNAYDFRHRVGTDNSTNEGANGYSTNFDYDEWYHIAIRANGRSITNWVDGVLVDSYTLSSNQTPNTDNWHIGMEKSDRYSSRFFLKGMIDELKIYNYALHDTLVSQDYSNPPRQGVVGSKSEQMIVNPIPVLDRLEIEITETELYNSVPFRMTVRGVDQFGNSLPNYKGPVLLSVNDGSGNLSITTIGDSLFQDGTLGEATIYLDYDKGETISITATDSINNTYSVTSQNLIFKNIADHFDVIVADPENLQVGSNFDITIRAKDGSDQVLTTYEGEIELGSTFENISGLPSTALFNLSDNGEITINNITVFSSDSGHIFVKGKGSKSLVAYYDFENDGKDHAYGKHHAQNTNVTFEKGNIPSQNLGYAGRFNGSDAFLKVLFHEDLQLTDYTILAWAKLDPTQYESQSAIISKGHRSDGINNMMVIGDVQNTPDLRHRIQTNISLNDGENGAAFPFDEWKHVAIRLDHRNISNFIDGVRVDGRNLRGTQNPNFEDLHIGAEISSNRTARMFFNGLIDEVKIYNYSLSDAEIANDFAKSDPYAVLDSKSDLMVVHAIPVLADIEINISGTEFYNSVPFEVTVRGVDQFGNTLENYSGPVFLSANGGDGTLTPDTLRSDQFQSGVFGEASRFISYSKGQTITITATDSVNSSYTVTSENITFQNVADYFDFVIPDSNSLQIGVPFDVTVIAKDENNQKIDTYEGTVRFGTTFKNVTLPVVQHVFTLADNGEYTISGVTINETGEGRFYANALGTQSLVAYYDFEDDLNDKAFSQHHASSNNINFVDSRLGFGRAVEFSGSNSFVKIDDDPELRLINYTISTWVYMTATETGSQGTVVSKGDRNGNPANNNQLVIDENTTTDFRHRTSSTDGSNQGFNPYGDLNIGQWYHMVIRLNGKTMSSWLDGVSLGTRSIPGPQDPNQADWYLGYSPDDNWADQLNGYMDEFKIYNYAISDQEIIDDYNNNDAFAPLKSKSQILNVTGLKANFVSTITAGITDTLTIYQPYSGYNESLTIISSDAAAVISNPNPTLNTDSIQILIELQTAGAQTISITDGSLTTVKNIVVDPTNMAGFRVELPPSSSNVYDLKTPYDLTVTAIDTFNNTFLSYTGTVSFSFAATLNLLDTINLPSNYTFIAGDSGQKVFEDGVYFTGTLANGAHIDITDGTYTGSTSPNFIVAEVAEPDRYEIISRVSSFVAGKSDTLEVRAVDINGSLMFVTDELDITTVVSGTHNIPATIFIVNGIGYIDAKFNQVQENTKISVRSRNFATTGSIDTIHVIPNSLYSVDMAIGSTNLMSGELTSLDLTLRDSLNNIKTDFVGDFVLSSDAGLADKGLVAYYNFENNVNNQAGSNHNGTVSGGLTYETSQENMGLAGRFTGTNFIQIADHTELRFTEKYTLTAWVRIDNSPSSGQGAIVSKGIRSGQGINSMMLYDYSADDLRHRVGTDASVNEGENGYVLNRDEWYHITIKLDGNTITNWVNGIIVDGPRNLSGSQKVNSQNFYIGSENGTRYNFQGLIDEVKIYNYSLTESQIQADYKNALFSPRFVTFSEGNQGIKSLETGFDLLGETTLRAEYNAIKDSIQNIAIRTAKLSSVFPDTVDATTPYDLTVFIKSFTDSAATEVVSGEELTFSSSDPSAILPATYTFTNNNGQHTFVNGVQFSTAGNQTLTVTNIDGIEEEISVYVRSNLDASGLIVSSNKNPMVAGEEFTVTIKAVDSGDNLVANYTGSIDFEITDVQGTLGVATYTFDLADKGEKTFSGFDFKTAGNQIITVTDQDDSAVSGSDTILVRPGAPTDINIENLTQNVTTGIDYDPMVTARDAYSNVASSYIGTVRFTVDRPTSANDTLFYSYDLDDNGQHIFSDIQFDIGENDVLSVDIGNTEYKDSVRVNGVNPGVVTDYQIAVLTDTIVAGVTSDITVIAVDGSGTPVTNYDGTVSLSSSDSDVTFATGAYDFQGTENGTHTLANEITLQNAGNQTVTFADAVNGLNYVHNIYVKPAATDSAIIELEHSDFYIDGQTYDLTITLRDQYGNLKIDANEAVTLAESGNSIVTFNGGNSVVFTPSDDGVKTLTGKITFSGAGATTIQTSEYTTDGLFSVTVNPAATVTHFEVSGFTDPVSAGTQSSITITAKDVSNNDISISGQVDLSTSDASIVGLPANITFSAQTSYTINNIEFRKTGTHYIRAELNSDTNVNGRQNGISVTPATLNTIELTNVASRYVSGEEANLDLTLKDSYGNIKTDFEGTVYLKSIDEVAGVSFTVDTLRNSNNAKITRFLSVENIPNTQGTTIEYVEDAKTVNFHPIAGTTTVYNDVSYTWMKENDSDGHFTNQLDALSFKNSVVYVYSKTDKLVDFALSTDDGYGLYLNGALVGTHKNQSGNSTNRGRLLEDVELSAGWNTIVFAVKANSSGDFHSLAIYEADQSGGLAYTDGVPADIYYTNDHPFLLNDTGKEVYFTSTDLGSKSGKVIFAALGDRSIYAESSTITSTTENLNVDPSSYTIITSTDTVTANEGFNLTLEVLNILEQKDLNDLDATTLTFTSSDIQAELPTDYTFQSGDNGEHTFNNVVLKTQGEQTLTISDGTTSYTHSFYVSSNLDAAKFSVVANPNPMIAGNGFALTIKALDAGDNIVTNYVGTADITVTDAQAQISSTVTFTLADKGQVTLSGQELRTAGNHVISVIDQTDENILGEDSVLVRAGAPTDISIDNLTRNVTNGATYNPIVSARDDYGNVATSYIGTIEFATPEDTLSYDYQLNDNGQHTFTPIIFTIPGDNNIIARDINNSQYIDSTIVTVVGAGIATDFTISSLTDTIRAGVASDVTITVVDGYGSTITDYTGNVVVTSSDTNAIITNSPIIFTSQNNGDSLVVDEFEFRIAGEQTARFMDAANELDKIHNIHVLPAKTDSAIIELEESAFYVVGETYDVTIILKDQFGNIKTDTTETVTLQYSSGDGATATFNSGANAQIEEADDGIKIFTGKITFNTEGTLTLSTIEYGAKGELSNILVSSANTVTQFSVRAYTDPVEVGSSGSVTIVAQNASGGTVTTFNGSVNLSSSDTNIQGIGANPYSGFVNGELTINNIIFQTVGSHYIRAELSTDSDVFGRQNQITVRSGPVNNILLHLTENRYQSGEKTDLTVRVTDQFGNVKTDFVGDVNLNSTEEHATIGFSTTELNQSNSKITRFLVVENIPAINGSNIEYTDGSRGINYQPAENSKAWYNDTSYNYSKREVSNGFFSNILETNEFLNAVTYVYSSSAKNIDISLSAENGYGLYINGNLISENTNSGGSQSTRGALLQNVSLNEGWNTLLFSVKATSSTDFFTIALNKAGEAGTASFSDGTPADVLISNDNPYYIPTSGKTLSFTTSDLGEKIFPVSFAKTGLRSLRADYSTVNNTVSNIEITPVTAVLSAYPTTTNADQDFSMLVEIQDAISNRAKFVPNGVTLRFSSTDSEATLPADYTFVTADSAQKYFTSEFRFKNGGTHLITATLNDGSNSTDFNSDSIDVAVSNLVQSLRLEMVPGPKRAGSSYDLTLTALDGGNNRVSDYEGTITFTSTDSSVTLPSDYTFTLADAGQVVLANAVTFYQAGNVQISSNDIHLTYINGSIDNVVLADSVYALEITSPQASVSQGASFDMTVRATDRFGNTVQDYVDHVIFSPLDIANTTLGVDEYTFSTNDHGSRIFAGNSYALTGEFKIAVSDTVSGSTVLKDTLTMQSLLSTEPTKYVLTSLPILPDTIIAGVVYSTDVEARNDFDNLMAGYDGEVADISTTDPNAFLSDTLVTFTNGIANLTDWFRFETVGSQTITIEDEDNTNLRSNISVYVKHGEAISFDVSVGSDTLLTDGKYDITVTVRDVVGNPVEDYTGTILLSTSNTNSNILSSYIFTSSDNGTVVLENAIEYFSSSNPTTIQVVDQSNGSIGGTSSEFVVKGTTLEFLTVEEIPNYTINQFFNVNANDTSLFVFKLKNTTSTAVNFTGMDLQIAISHTFNQVSDLRLIFDVNNDGLFDEVPTAATFNPVSNVLLINGFSQNVPATDSLSVAIYGDVAGVLSETVTLFLTLNENTDLHFAAAANVSDANLPIVSGTVTVELGATEGTLVVNSGANMPVAYNVVNTENNIDLAQIHLANNTNLENILLDSIEFSLNSQVNTTDISEARLYDDVNGDGNYNTGDILLETVNTFASTSEIIFKNLAGYTVNQLSNKNVLLTVDLNGNASVGDTLSISVSSGQVYTTGISSSAKNRTNFSSGTISSNFFEIGDFLVVTNNQLSNIATSFILSPTTVVEMNFESPSTHTIIDQITVNVGTTGSDAETMLTSAIFYEEDGTVVGEYNSGDDTTLKNAVISGNTITFNGLALTINGAPRTFGIQVTFSGNGESGTELSFDLPSNNVFVTTQGNVASTNFPINGRDIDFVANFETTAMSDVNIQSSTTYEALKFAVTTALDAKINSIDFANTLSGDLAEISEIRLESDARGIVGTISNPSASLSMTLTDVKQTYSSNDTLRLMVDVGTLTQSRDYRFEILDANAITFDRAQTINATFPIATRSLLGTYSYTLQPHGRSSTTVAPAALGWMGAFTVEVPTDQTITALRISNRIAGGGTVDANDIDSVFIYLNTDVNADPTAGVPVAADSLSGANGGDVYFTGLNINTGNTSATLTAIHIVYKWSSTYDQEHKAGVAIMQEADITFTNSISPAMAFPVRFQNDFTLPVEIKEFRGEGTERGVLLTLETASELNAREILIEREDIESGDVEIIHSFELTGSVSSGGVYKFEDKSAEFFKKYRYTPIEITKNDQEITYATYSIESSRLVPEGTSIGSAYPNPANPVSSIRLTLAKPATMNVIVYNVLGQKVRTFKNIKFDVGFHIFKWNGKNNVGNTVSSGIYFMKMQIKLNKTNKRINSVQKIMILK
jgi:hypothetical protein